MAKVALVYNLKQPKSEALPCDYCSEFDSRQTIEAISQALSLGGHQVFPLEADEKILDWLRLNRVDMVFNIAEGFSGSSREAQVPAILDFLGIPYTGSGVLTLALSLDKAMTKQLLKQQGIPTPKFKLFKKGAWPLFDSVDSLKRGLAPCWGFPLIVKPNCEGSAKGIHASNVVRDYCRLYEEVAKIERIYQQDVLVEEFIEGVELTVGILGNREHTILPVLEIDFSNCRRSGESFYSWKVKEYQGVDPRYPDPQFFCPARLSPAQEAEVKKVARASHQALGCRDVSRVDIRLSADAIPYVLEVNPLAGLDPRESNLTRMAQACELSYSDLINAILESALNRYQLAPGGKDIGRELAGQANRKGVIN